MTPLPAARLIFDLDGTLSDPVEGITRSFDHALTHFGLPPLRPEQHSAVIGPPLDVSFRALLGREEPDLVTALVARYRERYAVTGYAENRLYPGVPEALATLTARGEVMGLCSSKRVDFCEQILALFGLRGHFAWVDGGDVGIAKRDQLRRLQALGALHPQAWMIGDRAVDIDAARANGLRGVAVRWGHGSETEFAHATRVLDAPAQWLDL